MAKLTLFIDTARAELFMRKVAEILEPHYLGDEVAEEISDAMREAFTLKRIESLDCMSCVLSAAASSSEVAS